jgi:hypothetical protein
MIKGDARWSRILYPEALSADAQLMYGELVVREDQSLDYFML